MFDEDKHPRGQPDNKGQFAAKEEKSEYSNLPSAKNLAANVPQNAWEQNGMIKKTPAEKIASVHIDFTKDNILPELNEEDLVEVGSKVNKPVLLKKSVIDRNAKRHSDTLPDTELILKNALYNPSEVFKGNKEKPYYTFVKPMKISNRNGLDEYGIVLIDVDDKKDNFEIVHWHWVNAENIEKLKK